MATTIEPFSFNISKTGTIKHLNLSDLHTQKNLSIAKGNFIKKRVATKFYNFCDPGVLFLIRCANKKKTQKKQGNIMNPNYELD